MLNLDYDKKITNILKGPFFMENRDLRIANSTRGEINFTKPLFSTQKGLSSFYREASEFAYIYNEYSKQHSKNEYLSAAKLNATAVLHLIYQAVLSFYLSDGQSDFFSRRVKTINENEDLKKALDFFTVNYPSIALEENKTMGFEAETENMRGYFIFQVMLNNPALISAAKPLITPDELTLPRSFKALSSILSSFEKDDLRDGEPNKDDIFTLLSLPSRLYPNSLESQIKYMLREWSFMLPSELKRMLENSLDFIKEEEKDHGFGGAPGPMPVADYSEEAYEYEAFSLDSNWMPRVVMIAKSTLVWLDQLSKKYKRSITTLDQIPDEELDLLKERGFTALWLIGLWQRSEASKRIKHLCGNPEAEASAYSLKDYDISDKIGGWQALDNLRERANQRGIRLASDMVPNHTGLDGNWVYDHPEYYISQDYSPFPSYTYNGPDLSDNPNFEIKLEDHYYDRTDAAVTFRLTDKRNGKVRYVFHGNDGTTMPWNDTAQLDFLNPATREAVIQKIIHVARCFPIIRFDAAMTLAKRHIERLWYPKPGTGGDIAGRAEHSLSVQEFNKRIPEEFWREVVDRIAVEVPDTLLLAEAFWMMEGYFVRTLGMHRVYNSAFMNMLKNQENQKYRQSIKNTLEFEPEILKRYVNFMNNPDEDTAIAQFGDGDRYFGIATILATLPGLPMIGHGQIEGYREKYGMEYSKAYYDESPNERLISEHYRRIFPLFRKRYLFSGVEHFNLYDCMNNGNVQEAVFAYVNGSGAERNLVIVNNQYERSSGVINKSANKTVRKGDEKVIESISLAENLSLHFSAKNYVIFDCFTDGLSYLYPSMNIFDYGFNISLNGYESKVYWNIREVEDTDGIYEKLYSIYKDKGIKNINKAIMLLKLAPIYKILEPLRRPDYLKLIDEIIKGKSTRETERSALLTLAEVYTTLYESYPSMDESAKGLLDVPPYDVKPAPIVNIIKATAKLFSAKGSKAMRSWSSVDESVPLLCAIALTILPFSKGLDIKGTMEISDRLLISDFFENAMKSAGYYKEDEMRALAHEGALLLSAYSLSLLKPDDILRAVLNDSGIMNLTKCNEYKGEIWFNKERMQKTILIASFAKAIEGNVPTELLDKEIAALLEKEMKSGYKLNTLLAKNSVD